MSVTQCLLRAKSNGFALLWVGLVGIHGSVLAGGLAIQTNCDFTALDSRVSNWVDAGLYPGAAVLVAKDNHVIHQQCFGGYTPETEVFIASSGKWLAAATIMSLVDGGKLSLDDHPSKFLPEFKGDAQDAATLRQMLSHTSGYSPYQPGGNPADHYQTLSESVAQLLPLPPESRPGEHFEYGGLAMQVAGRMAEVAAGMDWEAIFQERIAQPCGMTNTHFTPVDLGGGHSPMLGGGARSNLRDYANFLSMIYNDGQFAGKQVLSANAIREMQADQVRGAKVKREEFVERVRGKTHTGIYGLGEWREELDAAGNATLLSSPSWAGAYPWIDKKNGVYGILLAHVDVARANPHPFFGFWASPSLAMLTRRAMEEQPPNLPNFTNGYVRVNGADFYYETAGAGVPIIFIHAHSVDCRMWDAQFAGFAKTHRVIRYDLRGYGLSDLPVEGENFSHAEDLSQLMAALGVAKAHLVGLSMGAFVVGDLVALHPEKTFSATVSAGGVYDGWNGTVDFFTATNADKKARRLAEIEALRQRGVEVWKKEWLNALVCARSPRSNEVRVALGQMIADWSAWQALHMEPASLLGGKVVERLRAEKVSVPVLGICAEYDGGTNNSGTSRLLAVIPNSKKVLVSGAGHFANLDQPEAFNCELWQFIESVDRAK
jgi:CubicO group peptidase (beta-lactamase class C family)/pimeloyl-ACP methyl ester carboxylesterase